MRHLSVFGILVFLTASNALFGFGGSKTTTTTTQAPKPSLGREINIPFTNEEDSNGEIQIPLNHPPTTTPKISVGGIGLGTRKSTVDVRFMTTTTMNPKFTAATKRLPSSDREPSSGCPNRIDAYTFGPDNDYAFYGPTVYRIKNNRIQGSTRMNSEFPGGPKFVNGALYDPEREIMWLLEDKSVFGFKKSEEKEWKLQSVFPKELPSSIPFTPDAAIRWHNKHQVLLSNGGKFALYDEYWNKSLLSGRTEQYFENLPDRVRGISTWIDGTAHVFTQSLVFEYDSEKKKVTGDGVALGDFWRC